MMGNVVQDRYKCPKNMYVASILFTSCHQGLLVRSAADRNRSTTDRRRSATDRQCQRWTARRWFRSLTSGQQGPLGRSAADRQRRSATDRPWQHSTPRRPFSVKRHNSRVLLTSSSNSYLLTIQLQIASSVQQTNLVAVPSSTLFVVCLLILFCQRQ